MWRLGSLNLTKDTSHALVPWEPCCSSDDHVILPEDITENRKQWEQTPPETLLSILAKAELSDDSFMCFEEDKGRTFFSCKFCMFFFRIIFLLPLAEDLWWETTFWSSWQPRKTETEPLLCPWSTERPLPGYCCFQKQGKGQALLTGYYVYMQFFHLLGYTEESYYSQQAGRYHKPGASPCKCWGWRTL